MVISWLIHIGITISVTQLVGAYMMSSMYMFMVMSRGFIEQLCPGQPLSMTSWSLTEISTPCNDGDTGEAARMSGSQP